MDGRWSDLPTIGRNSLLNILGIRGSVATGVNGVSKPCRLTLHRSQATRALPRLRTDLMEKCFDHTVLILSGRHVEAGIYSRTSVALFSEVELLRANCSRLRGETSTKREGGEGRFVQWRLFLGMPYCINKTREANEWFKRDPKQFISNYRAIILKGRVHSPACSTLIKHVSPNLVMPILWSSLRWLAECYS